MNVKKRTMALALPLMLMCICLISTSVHAIQPIMKEITHEVIDGPMDDMYAKGFMHGTLVGRIVGESLRAKIGMIQKLNVYELIGEDEPGEFIGVLNMDIQYSGTVKPNGDLELITGTYSATWIIVLHVDIELPFPEDATLKGHMTRIYKDGEIIKEILKGVPPFELPY